MTQETNLNIAPYFDDFDTEKNYHRILFRPSFPIQARELTQLQTILQNQIERFGQNIYKTGTVISGCSVYSDPKYHFVRFRDLDSESFDVNIADFANCTILDTSTGLKAIITNIADGTEADANNNLKTAFVKYINASSNSTQTTFTDGSTVFVQKQKASVEDIRISNSGTGYTNSMFVYAVQSSPAPVTNAYGRIVTNSTGNIADITIINPGEGYTKSSALITTTVTYANGTAVPSNTANGAVFSVVNYVSQPIVAANGTGIGYGLRVSDGIIFQKGFFIRVEPQEIVVSKYLSTGDGYPNNVSVGFVTEEAIVNSSVDETLLDNASGYTNYQAPGADRLELTPTLAVRTSNALSDVVDGIPSVENFFTLVEFQNGNIIRDKTSTQFNAVDTELARRTFEESGNYVVRPINVQTEEASDVYGAAYANVINVIVGRGTAYVQGYRNELTNNIRIQIPKANTTVSTNNQVISTSYENYFSVPQDKWFGIANVQYGETITLFANTVSVGNSGIVQPGGAVPSLPSALGTTRVAGTAKVRSITYNGFEGSISENKYKVYVFDVQLNSGFNSSDIQAIGINQKFLAEVDIVNGVSLIGTQNEPVIFPLGVRALASISDDDFYYKKEISAAVNGNGQFSITASGGEQFLYTSDPVTDLQKTDFVVVSTNNIVSTNLAGTVNVYSNGLISGSGTPNLVSTFAAYKDYGIYIQIANGSAGPYYYPVESVINGNTAYLPSYANVEVLNANVAYCVPNNAIINPKLLTVNASISSVSFKLEPWSNVSTMSSIGNVSLICTSIATPTSANLQLESHYIKVSNTLAATLPNGPWCLGIPNAVKIEGVWVGSGDTFADDTVDPNIKDNFVLVTGQKDSVYGLSYIKPSRDSAFTLTSTKNLLIKVQCFRPQLAGDYITLESYVYANGSPAPVENIPVYKTSAGKLISLRDAVDFRVFVVNNAVNTIANMYKSTPASAWVLTSSTSNATHIAHSNAVVEIYSSSQRKFPSPTGLYEADLSYFTPRRDRVIMDKDGNVKVVVGIPSINPDRPAAPTGTLTLGDLYVPPYPSLAYYKAIEIGRLDYAITIDAKQQTRFTMNDIQEIQDRVGRLEYYSSFSLLESQTKSLKITSEANTQLERFKNGFFVDPMRDRSFSDALFNNTFEIDTFNEIATPTFKQIPLKLKIANTANTTIFDSIVSDSSHVFLESTTLTSDAKFDKPTSQRNLINGFVKFNGTLYVNPPFDVSITSGRETTNQYIKPQTITLYVTGLQPNRKHYIFFDGVDITAKCKVAVTPASTAGNTATGLWGRTTDSYGLTSVFKRTRAGNGSDSVYTNGGLFSGWRSPEPVVGTTELTSTADGRLTVQYAIPASTYIFGPKDIIVMDVGLLSSEDTAVSIAKGLFYGFNTVAAPQKPPVIVSSGGGGSGGWGVNTGDACAPISIEAATTINNAYGGDVLAFASQKYDSCTLPWVGDTTFWQAIQNELRRSSLLKTDGESQVSGSTSAVKSSSAGEYIYETPSGITNGSGSLDTIVSVPSLGVSSLPVSAGSVPTNRTRFKSLRLSSDPAVCSFGVDPLGQTFRTTVDTNASGKWAYAINLLFARKSDPNVVTSFLPYSGVTVEIRTTVNGYPSSPSGVIARTHLISDSINVLSTNSTSFDTTKYTTFALQEPVFLENNKEYAIIVYPDGNSTDYLAWVGKVGETVFATNIKYTTQDGVTPGVLFMSTNQTAWTPIQAEDLVYDVKVMNFDKTAGHVTLVPNNYEFLTFNNLVNKKAAFKGGVSIGQLTNTYCNGYFSANSGALLTGPTVDTSRPFIQSSISDASYQIAKATGSLSFTNFNEGDGIIILRVEPDMVKYSPASNNFTSVDSLPSSCTVVTGNSSTAYDTVLQVGDFIVIPNVGNTNYGNTLFSVNASNGELHGCIRQVVSVANSTEFTIDSPVSTSSISNTAFWVANNVKTFVTTVYSGNNTVIQLRNPLTSEFVAASNGSTFAASAANIAYAFQRAPIGLIDTVDSVANKLHIEGSTANATLKFLPSNSTFLGTLVSTDYTNTTSFSTSYANVVSIDEYVIDRVSTVIRNTSPLGTNISANLSTNYSSAGNSTIISDYYLNNISVIPHDAVLKSKSAEANAESLSVKVNLSTASTLCSPKVTVNPSSIVVYSAQINSNTTNENWANNAGAAQAKYVSKTSTLSAELDAEDIFVYLTAFRPSGSDIKVYVKVKAREDSRKIDDINWSELVIDSNENVYSSSSDTSDYKEYRYTFRKKPQTTVTVGTASYDNNTPTTITGIGTLWNTVGSSKLAVNDVIAIVNPSDVTVYDVAVVNSVSSDTSITLKTSLLEQGVFINDTNGLVVEKLTYPTEAFKYYGNDNIVRYYSSGLTIFDTYQQFAIKVVMTRDRNGVVPYINDVRAIATSI